MNYACQDKPTTFGEDQNRWPIEQWDADGFIPVPVIHASRTFKNTCSVSISTESLDAFTVEYALLPMDSDSQEPSNWVEYGGPFKVDTSTIIHARTVQGARISSVVDHALKQVNHPYTLVMNTPLSNQYAAGGDQALIDGIEGGNQYQTGDWQGYWGTDITGTIDLKNPVELTGVSIGALRDIRPWIYLPKHISISCSLDGKAWSRFGQVSHAIDQDDEVPIRHTFRIDGRSMARYVRFQVQNHGLLPEGHLGAGNPSWVFMDEVSLLINRP